ncbi:hypothetical protein [Saccharothrix longispora]|uniref:hypothetical protein n=1 Tax=Saccharothrix longispora TaxID=33920 RepID=UPI0028FDA391|nr:hypothetical protein [Saccharothrix longispora]MDU0289047.1 hypothetical protein [Saccharothrix longispora]
MTTSEPTRQTEPTRQADPVDVHTVDVHPAGRQPTGIPPLTPSFADVPPVTVVPRPGRAPVVVLTALAVVFAVVAAVFTVLHADAGDERDRLTAARLEEERALSGLQAQQEEADRVLEDNRSRHTTLTTRHDVLTRCVDAAKAYFDLPPLDSPESSRLFRIMYEVCPQV